jgi:hypothetical protein
MRLKTIRSILIIFSFIISAVLYNFISHDIFMYGIEAIFFLFGLWVLRFAISDYMYDPNSPEIIAKRIEHIKSLYPENYK